jgi:FkbM family methyltransferase
MPFLMDAYRRARRFSLQLTGRDVWCGRQIRCDCESLGVPGAVYFVNPNGLTADSIVYSFGVGDNIAFDLALIRRFRARVHAFDPTPRALEWIRSQILPDRFIMHELGLADYDGVAVFHPPDNADFVSYTTLGPTENERDARAPVRRLKTIMESLGHDRIDLLKMDIEGAEYAVVNDLVQSRIRVGQLLIEFHHRWPGVGAARTRDAIEALNAYGLKVFHVSPTGMEYSFVNCRE